MLFEPPCHARHVWATESLTSQRTCLSFTDIYSLFLETESVKWSITLAFLT